MLLTVNLRLIIARKQFVVSDLIFAVSRSAVITLLKQAAEIMNTTKRQVSGTKGETLHRVE